MDEERRHHQPGRRAADAHAFVGAAAIEVIDEDVREIAIAIQRVKRSWKRWAVIVGAIGTVVSGTVGVMVWLGWTSASPDERFRKHDQTMRAGMAAVTGDVATLKARVSNVEEAVDLMSYLLCVQIRRSDPAALPPKCNEASIRNLAPR